MDESAAGASCGVLALAAAAVALGAGNSLATRALLLQDCPASCVGNSGGGADAGGTFAKPLFTVAVAFAAMALSLPASLAARALG